MKYKILYYPVVLTIIIFFTSCSGIKGNIYTQENNMDSYLLRLSRENSDNYNNKPGDDNNNSYNNENSDNNNGIGNNDNSSTDNTDRDHDNNHKIGNNNDTSARIQKSEKKLKLYIKDIDEIELWTEINENISLITKFSKKDWGTWNIKGWYTAANDNAIDNAINNEKTITGGSTDWEYVLRIVNPQDNKWYFSGGNHGNERLKSISFSGFFSQKTSDDNNIDIDIKIEPGEIIELQSLKVTEITVLDVEQINLKEYATVYREYTFEPQRVQLTTIFKFNNNVRVGTSYITMFPILKEFGRYCRFDDSNIVVETPKTGYTKGGEDKESYLGKVATLSTTIWGDNDTGYKFRVWIERPEMVDNFNNQLKVFLWDLNKFSNKLYYSKYDTSNPVEVKTGTEWYHKQGWDFIYEE